MMASPSKCKLTFEKNREEKCMKRSNPIIGMKENALHAYLNVIQR